MAGQRQRILIVPRNVIVAVVLFLLVADRQQCAADKPADHQRKIHGRMLWPKQQPNDVASTFSRQMVIRFPKTGSLLDESFPSGERHQPLLQRDDDEGGADYASIMDAGGNGFLTFSLAASDAEGAEGYYHRTGSSASDINEQMHNKLDLLNQLLRFAPDADAASKSEQQEGSGNVEVGYDKCNHPFHSWMCTKKGESQQKRPAVPSVSAPPAVIVDPFPDAASVISDVQLTTTSTSSTVRPTEKVSKGWEGADPCTHPFHSWLCGDSIKMKPDLKSPEESPRPDASVFGDNVLLPPATSTATAPPTPSTTTSPPPAPSGSWEGADPCTHPFHSWLCNRSPSAKPKMPTRAPIPPPVIVPDASFIIDDTFFISEVITSPSPKPTTTPTPSTTEASILIRTMMPKGGWDEADSCSHPFHSWLCAKSKPKATTTPTTTTTTTPPPFEENVFEPELAPSIENTNNQLIPDAQPPPPPIKSGWDEADSCSHPFHSWLCVKPKTFITTPPPTLPPPPPPPAKFEKEILPFPDASNQVPEPAPEPTPTRTAKTNKGSWDGADPCTHPLHSWLCKRAVGLAAPSSQTLIGRKLVRSSGRSISSSNSETDLTDEETIRGLENFESLRLSPPIGRRVRNSDGSTGGTQLTTFTTQ